MSNGTFRRTLGLGGLVAAVILMAFGIAAIVVGLNGRSTVHSSLKQQQLVGTTDMTPKAITAEAKQAGLVGVSMPTCSVAGKAITNGGDARCFAQYMFIHAMEATGGKTYSQMPTYVKAGGGLTSDKTLAAKDANGQAIGNPARNTWVTETALSTALNASYMAEQTALFGIAVGVALLLIGFGLGVLDLATFARRLMQRAPAAEKAGPHPPAAAAGA